MGKIPSRRVPSDDCLVHVGRRVEDGQIVDEGEAYNVHEGEWVEVVPVVTMRQYIEINHLSKSLTAQDIDGMERSMDALCKAIAQRVVAWNWTDNEGVALPPPTEGVIRELTEDELVYLITAIQGETAGQRGNGSTPSPTRSSTKRAQPLKVS